MAPMRYAIVLALLSEMLLTPTQSLAAKPGVQRPSGQMSWTADRVEVDGRSRIASVYRLEVTQGVWTVSGNEGRLNWDKQGDSQWQVDGAVKVRGVGSNILGDSGTLTVAANVVRSVHLEGNPATFDQALASLPSAIRGNSAAIDLDMQSRLVALNGDAHATMGAYELWADRITYDMDAQKLGTQSLLPGHDTHMVVAPPQQSK